MAALKGVCDLNRQKHILRNLTKVDRMLTQTTEPSWLWKKEKSLLLGGYFTLF